MTSSEAYLQGLSPYGKVICEDMLKWLSLILKWFTQFPTHIKHMRQDCHLVIFFDKFMMWSLNYSENKIRLVRLFCRKDTNKKWDKFAPQSLPTRGFPQVFFSLPELSKKRRRCSPMATRETSLTDGHRSLMRQASRLGIEQSWEKLNCDRFKHIRQV